MDFISERKDLLRHLQEMPVTYTAFSKTTNLPYVECDGETYDDQVHTFETKEQADAFIQEHAAQNIPLLPVSIQQKDMLQYYTSLYMMGVNRVVFHGTDSVNPLPLNKIVVLQTPPDVPEDIPSLNTSLQLTGAYFLQELRRPGQEDEKLTADEKLARMERLKQLEQELVINLVRSRFIIPVNEETEADAAAQTETAEVDAAADQTGTVETDGAKNQPSGSGRIRLPYMKAPNGDIVQPVFSDLWEFQKFAERHPSTLKIMPVKNLGGLPSFMIKEAKAFVLNPSGFNLVITRDRLEALIDRFFSA